ncbi:hypothetical protein D3C76_1532950 [compost metagenome]
MQTRAEGVDDHIWITEVVSRDELGGIRSSRTYLASEALPALPFESAAREYQPSVPRKLYGND